MSRDICKNCGRIIGQLEEAFVYRDNPVCGECYGRLIASSRGAPTGPRATQQPAASNRRLLFIAGAVVAIVAVGGTVAVIKVIERRDSPRAAGHPPSLTMIDPPARVTAQQPATPIADRQSQAPVPQQLAPRPAPPPPYRQGNLSKEMSRMRAEIETAFPTIPPEKLVGKTFIIARNSAYEERPNEPFLSIGDFDNYPIYKDVVEKTCTLVKLNPKEIAERAIIQMDGTKKRYPLMVTSDPYVPMELILASEIDSARARWKGKTLWYRGDTLLLEQKSSTGKIQSIKVTPYSKMSVAEVKPSGSAWSPVELVLRTPSGERGFIDCTLSGTTVPSTLRETSAFYKMFLETDPRVLCPHSPEIWAQIESKTVSIGMNAEQVLLSWGQPRDIKTTVTADGRREQWVYWDDRFVYVTNGAVTGIQD
jgi:hypothetical protein